VAKLCILGDQLIDVMKFAERKAWSALLEDAVYPELAVRQKPLLSAEMNLLTHAKSCESCSPAVHFYFLP